MKALGRTALVFSSLLQVFLLWSLYPPLRAGSGPGVAADLFQLDALRPSTVVITGLTHAAEEEILEILLVQGNLLQMGGIEPLLERLPGVAEATVVRRIPGEVRVLIREEPPVLSLPGGWVVLADGAVRPATLPFPVFRSGDALHGPSLPEVPIPLAVLADLWAAWPQPLPLPVEAFPVQGGVRFTWPGGPAVLIGPDLPTYLPWVRTLREYAVERGLGEVDLRYEPQIYIR